MPSISCSGCLIRPYQHDLILRKQENVVTILQVEMEGPHGNGTQVGTKVMQNFQKNFVQVQNILDQNRLLINEINQNQESKIPDNITRNVGLIRELNNNIRRVVDLYADISGSFFKNMDTSSESDVKYGGKRSRTSG